MKSDVILCIPIYVCMYIIKAPDLFYRHAQRTA